MSKVIEGFSSKDGCMRLAKVKMKTSAFSRLVFQLVSLVVTQEVVTAQTSEDDAQSIPGQEKDSCPVDPTDDGSTNQGDEECPTGSKHNFDDC